MMRRIAEIVSLVFAVLLLALVVVLAHGDLDQFEYAEGR